MINYLCAFGLIWFASAPALEDEKEPASLEDRTKGLEQRAGFLPLYIDEAKGTVLLEPPADGESFLYSSGLSSGLGSNPVGLDRGQWGKTRLVRFKRVGKRVYLIEQNVRYRASAPNAAEKKAVSESFANSVFWATDIVAQTGDRVLIDLSTLLTRDAHRVVETLKSTDQGDYKFDKDLSFVELDRCKAFPANCELDAMVTYTADESGSLVGRVAADGNSFTLRLHHSFVKLPEPGYKPRRADPRVAASALTFADYSAPLDKPIEQRIIARHRLEKKNPGDAKSPPVEPIVYYLDPGTPQPVRDALLEGARWWNEAFEAAGFVDAFQVRMLPDDADPMDVRFNVIQWVHRRTRGWSYGQSIVDPRTGEIIKGHVLLGSLRVRQDRLIMEGITSAPMPASDRVGDACGIAGTGVHDVIGMFAQNISPLDVSLARLRQLSAHEVGHTIGFNHNFAASTYADRASVMDYPAPRVKVTDNGELDLSDAYGVGVGEWDKFMVRYAYASFEGDEEQGLQELLDEASERGLLYLTDADARPAAAANPRSNLWDNGTDPITELRHLQNVRRIAMEKLGAGDLIKGQALSDLEMVLVPVYLYHRYQVDAVAKMLGGFDYDYAVVGSERKPVTPIQIERQQQALDALLGTLEPRDLIISDRLLKLLAPRPFSSANDRERFASRVAMIFDPDAAVAVAAEITLGQILEPERTARLEAYSDTRWNLPIVLGRVTAKLVRIPNAPRERHVLEIVHQTYVRELVELASNESTSHSVRAAASDQLRNLRFHFERGKAAWPNSRHATQVMSEIDRFLARPHTPAAEPEKLPSPPGSPIGG